MHPEQERIKNLNGGTQPSTKTTRLTTLSHYHYPTTSVARQTLCARRLPLSRYDERLPPGQARKQPQAHDLWGPGRPGATKISVGYPHLNSVSDFPSYRFPTIHIEGHGWDKVSILISRIQPIMFCNKRLSKVEKNLQLLSNGDGDGGGHIGLLVRSADQVSSLAKHCRPRLQTSITRPRMHEAGLASFANLPTLRCRLGTWLSLGQAQP